MNNIRIFADDQIDLLVQLSGIKLAKEDRTFVFRFNSPKYFLSELYGYLKRQKELPELDRKRKIELWNESGKDKLLYLSLYVIEII